MVVKLEGEKAVEWEGLWGNREEEEIKRLEALKREKLAELARLKEEEEFLEADSYLGPYRKILFRRLPLDWLDSVYRTKVAALEKRVNASFQPQVVKNITEHIIQEKTTPVFTMALHCMGVIPMQGGTKMILQDPYRMITTNPLKLSLEEAEGYIDDLLLVRIRFTAEAASATEFEVLSLRRTRYTRLQEKTDHGLKDVFPESALIRYLDQKNVKGARECMRALDGIQGELERIGNRIETFCCRYSQGQLYIRRHGVKELLLVVGDHLEYIWQQTGSVDDAKEIGLLSNGIGIGTKGENVKSFLDRPASSFDFSNAWYYDQLLA